MKITTNRRLFLQGTAFTGVAAAIAGCSQQSADEQKKTQEAENKKKAEEQASLPPTAWEKADYASVKDGGTLTLAIAQLPANWNGSHPDGNEVSLSTINVTRGTGGVRVKEDGSKELDKDYILSAEVTNENPQKVTVKYNPKAKWDDGKPVVVDDFISHWKANNGSNEAFIVTSTQGWDAIKNIKKVDDHTAEIEYTSTFPDWIGYLYPGMPASASKDPATWNDAHKATPTPGYGPFKIANVDTTGGVVTLERNPGWWGQKPKLEKIIFKVTTQQNMPSAFANGELDAIDIGDGDTYGQAKGRQDASIQKSNGLTWTHLTPNVGGGQGVLQDVKVREAMFRAIDRDAVARAVLSPLEAPSILVDNYIYMPGQKGYEDSFGGLKFDQAASKKILEEAGYKLNGKVYEKDGKKLKFSIVIPAETKSNADRAKQVMTNLNQAGFEVDLKTVPSDKYFTDYVLKGAFDLVTFSWQGTAYAENSAPNTFLPESAQNYTGVKDTKLDELNKKIQTEMDPTERTKLANEFSKQVASNFMVLPFYATPNIMAVKKGLVNYGAAQFETIDWTTVGFKA